MHQNYTRHCALRHSLCKMWLVFDLNCSIKVVTDVREEEEVGVYSPGQTERDDLVLVEAQSSDDVLITNISAQCTMDS